MVAPDHNMNPTKGTTTLGGSPHAEPVRDLDVARLGLLAGAAIATLLVVTGAPVALAVALVPAAVAAAFDLDRGRLPSRWVAAATAVALATGLAPAPVGLGVAASAVFVPAAIAATAIGLLHLAWPAAVGWGDVTYVGALGFVMAAAGVGRPGPAISVWLCLASGSALVEVVIRGRASVAFGPHLLAAAVVIVGVTGGSGV